MSRLERKFPSEGASPADSAEILAALGKQSGIAGADEERCLAIARYLSAEEGWQDALRALGGAFAERRDGLTRGKGE